MLAARALTALFAVWCLGCAGYDPLVDSIFGREAGVDCGSEAGSASSESAASGVSGADSSEEGCLCVSCHSTTPQAQAGAGLRLRDLEVTRLAVADVPSVTRAPVAPPPEFTSL